MVKLAFLAVFPGLQVGLESRLLMHESMRIDANTEDLAGDLLVVFDPC
jgi:hypothetical protein